MVASVHGEARAIEAANVPMCRRCTQQRVHDEVKQVGTFQIARRHGAGVHTISCAALAAYYSVAFLCTGREHSVIRGSWTPVAMCSWRAVLAAAASGDDELLVLDGQKLQSHHLAQLLQHLARAGETSGVTAITLADNLLTDDSCAVLCSALRSPEFCPQLISINLAGNAGITALGHAHLQALLPDRPDLKVCPCPP